MTRLLLTMMVLTLCSAGAQAEAPDAPVVTVEAEDYAAMDGLRVLEREEASGGRTVSYWEEPGGWLSLRFDLPEAGEYLISLRYALNWIDTRRVVLLDGEELGEIELRGTGSWANFETITLPFEPLELPAGPVTLRLLNRDSRGLSLDRAALHAPDAPLGDCALSEKQRDELTRRLVEAVGPHARRILDFGRVELHATRAGGLARARVGEHVLAAADAPAADQGVFLRRQTAHHQVALVSGGPGQARLLVAITDGVSLHLVALADEGAAVRLPAPVLGAGGMRVVKARGADGASLHLPTGRWRHQTDHFEAGGLHISAAPGMVLCPWDKQALSPDLTVQTVACAGWHVGAARFSERWGMERPRVGLQPTERGCVVREVARRHPTLAAFYDEGMFELRIDANGRIAFEDLGSGETVVLREGGETG